MNTIRLIAAMLLLSVACHAQTNTATVNFQFQNGSDIITKNWSYNAPIASGNRIDISGLANTTTQLLSIGSVTNIGIVVFHNGSGSGLAGTTNGNIKFSTDGTNWCNQINSNEWFVTRWAHTNQIYYVGNATNIPFNGLVTSQ